MTTHIQPPALPQDLYSHLSDMDPRSHEFKTDLAVLNELAKETGRGALTLEHIFPINELIPPEGFASDVILPEGLVIPTSQFDGKIFSITSRDVITSEARQLTTDGSGKRVNLCDLRPFMTSAVRKGGPENLAEAQALDTAFFRDLRFYVETGHAKNSVTTIAKGVFYTKLNGKMDRAYWMPVKTDSPNGTTTIARIADCGNAKRAEADLYRRVFKAAL